MIPTTTRLVVYALFATALPFTWGKRSAVQVHNGDEVAGNATNEGGVKHDGAFFVILEVYMLKGTESSRSSKKASEAISGKNIAGLVEVADTETSNATQNSGAFYHSEVLICPRNFMTGSDVKYLEKKVKSLGWWTKYKLIPESKWESMDVRCQTLSYGGSDDEDECSGVSHFNQQLSARRAGIGNADLNHVWKYVYGTGDKSAQQVKDYVCRGSCGADWSGYNYNPVTRNCNFFSSTVMNCAYGLSQSTPNLGVSDMRSVWSCSC